MRLVALGKLVLLCMVLGAAVGVVWFLVAPTPEFRWGVTDWGYVRDLPSEYVAMDGWFAVLGTVAGIALAVVVLRRGRLDPWTVLAVGLASLLGALTAWFTGWALGRDGRESGDGKMVGEVVHGSLSLGAKGVLLFWPIVSLAILTFALAWSSRDERSAIPGEASDEADGLASEQSPASVGGDRDLGDLDRGQ